MTSCCPSPNVSAGARFCRTCGSQVAPPIGIPAAAPAVGHEAVATTFASAYDGPSRGGVAVAVPVGDRPQTGTRNVRTTASAGPSATIAPSGWVEPPPAFPSETTWESLPFERETRAPFGTASDSIMCLMCGFLCPNFVSNCPECDNTMGGAQGPGGGGPTSPELEIQVPKEAARPLSSATDATQTSRQSSITTSIDDGDDDVLEVLADLEWYEGPLTRPDAETILATAAVGSFLIRQRLNNEGFALAHRTVDKIRHYLVTQHEGHWRLVTGSPSPFFPTLDELVQYYMRSAELGGVTLRPREANGTITVADAGAALDTNRPSSAAIGGEQSPAFRKLSSGINGSERLFDLIALGNGILDAEENKMLYPGEAARLRRAYRIRRSILSYGCKKSSWQPNRDAKVCQNPGCGVKFTTTCRRHHCRSCGQLMCKACSSDSFEKTGLKLAKVCPQCLHFLTDVAKGRVKEAVATYGPTLGKLSKKISRP
mmetsp:Transcript_35731/g.93406  ORF Transcript_35731/g.93406 Transcript_35731/m.93406 type:complete len:485 (+) Transcript_35731:142-1596(+)